MFMTQLKEKMRAGEVVYGTFINSGTTIACEVAGLCGFDFVMIDSEHGPTAPLDNRELIMAAEYRGAAPLVRVSNGSSDLILRTLDVGAHGVMVPQVNTRELAEQAAGAARYFPEGYRGVASARASDYGFTSPLPHYFEKANKRNLCIVQCENIKCLPHLDEITAVPGVDVVFIGPYDLSTTMGVPGQVAYEKIKEVVDRVLESTKKHGKFAGIYVANAEAAAFYTRLGFQFIIAGTDIGCMAGSYRKLIADLRD